jgi:triacylglycerol lipase
MSILVALPEALYDTDAFGGCDLRGQFSTGNCRAMAWAAQLAYEADDPSKIDRVLGLWGLQRVALLNADVERGLPVASTRAFVAAGHGGVIVAFEGTDPLVLSNWITDFDVSVTRQGLHEGFTKAVDSIWARLLSVLRDQLSSTRKLLLTGHSLGGALAVVAASRLLATELAVAVNGVYTFGMPRVGKADFASDYGKLSDCTYRFVYGEDMVPTVPPSAWGFRHVGRRFSCARGTRFDTALSPSSAPLDDEPSFADGVLRRLTRHFVESQPGGLPGSGRTDPAGRAIEGLPAPIRDHLPDRYCGAV